MENRKADAASKMLLGLIRDITKLNEEQLLAVRRLTQETVGNVMQLVMNINSLSDPRNDNLFIANLGGNSQQSERFPKEVEAISAMNKQIGEYVVSLMGAVSMDDVISQRITHVYQAVERLNQALREFILDYQNQLTEENLVQFRNIVLTDVYRFYSGEEERAIFHNIIGKPKKLGKAA